MAEKKNGLFYPDTLIGRIEVVLKLLLIGGAMLTFWQYFSNKEQARVQETLHYVKAFNSGEIYKAKVKIDDAWLANERLISELQDKRVVSEEKEQAILKKVMLMSINDYNLKRPIETVVDFYEQLYLCTQAEVCDIKSARLFFTPHAKRFYKLYRPYLQDRNNTITGYAGGLSLFAGDVE